MTSRQEKLQILVEKRKELRELCDIFRNRYVNNIDNMKELTDKVGLLIDDTKVEPTTLNEKLTKLESKINTIHKK